MALIDQYTLANDAEFRQRVRTATIISANNIAAATDQPSWNYNFANEVIRNPSGGWIDTMTYQVVANPAITSASTDQEIQTAVDSNFEKVAKAWLGYIPPEPVEPEADVEAAQQPRK